MYVNRHSLNKLFWNKMSVFSQKVNPMTGKIDWELQNENYEYYQEIARSSYADMLHDTERNQKYDLALKEAIVKMHGMGRKANVLDVGTGTGLLSMMAARNGADSIVACEAFEPMSNCALKIIKLNGFEDKIKVIPKNSTDLTVGEDGDLKFRANILVTEVFDTELIGEGAYKTFYHAHEKLLEKDSIVIPHSATVYIQVVESPLALNWHKLKDIFDVDGNKLLRVPKYIQMCPGAPAVHDIQLSQFPREFFNTIVSREPVLEFNFSKQDEYFYSQITNVHFFKAERKGVAQAVFMWWNLYMDSDYKIVLSCAPYWAHPLVRRSIHQGNLEIPWRDHWMQAIYYLPKERPVQASEDFQVQTCRDVYSFWFHTKDHEEKPACKCGLHMAFSRTRIGQLNDGTRNKKYFSVINKCVNKDSVILVFGQGFYLSLAASKLGAKKIYYVDDNKMSKGVLKTFILTNSLENVEVFNDMKELINSVNMSEINFIVSEPSFITSILPWDNLLFIYLLKEVRELVSQNVEIIPKKAIIKGIAVQFADLHKIRAPVGQCEGFLMTPFDDLIKKASNISDSNVEAQPLWEYPGKALSEVVEIVNLDLRNSFDESSVESHGTFKIIGKGNCNGIALWIDWDLDGLAKHMVTTGPLIEPVINEKIAWDMYTRQGVCLLPKIRPRKEIGFSFKFETQKGDISFQFK